MFQIGVTVVNPADASRNFAERFWVDTGGLTHYFVPPHIVPGVEVARGAHTSDATYEIMCELMRRTGRIPIPIRRELPGYLINRLSAALSREALRLWAEGVATAEDIELGVKSTIGFRMPFYGPFGHYDLSGAWRWPDDPAGQPQPAAGAERGGTRQNPGAHGRAPPVVPRSSNHHRRSRAGLATAISSAAARPSTASPATARPTESPDRRSPRKAVLGRTRRQRLRRYAVVGART